MAPYFHIYNAKVAWLLYFCLLYLAKNTWLLMREKWDKWPVGYFRTFFIFFLLKRRIEDA